MTLANEQQQEIREWLKVKGIREDCVACGNRGWRIGDIIAPPAAPRGGGTVIGGASFGLAQLFCDKCGYVMHFNATHLGLTPSQSPDDQHQW